MSGVLGILLLNYYNNLRDKNNNNKKEESLEDSGPKIQEALN